MPVNNVLTQFAYSCEKKRTTLTAVVNFASNGTPTLEQWNGSTSAGPGDYSPAPTSAVGFAPAGTRGVAGITVNAAGDYFFAFQGIFQRLMDFHVAWVSSSTTSPAHPIAWVNSTNTSVDALTSGYPGALVEVCTASAANTACGAPESIQGLFTFVFDDSSV